MMQNIILESILVNLSKSKEIATINVGTWEIKMLKYLQKDYLGKGSLGERELKLAIIDPSPIHQMAIN